MDELEELERWCEEQAERERADGFSAQMRGQEILAATRIGREWAFYAAASQCRELQARRSHV